MRTYDLAVQTWKGWNIRTPAELDSRLDSFRVQFAYNSCRIENEEIKIQSAKEIFEKGKVTSFTGSPRTLCALQNQKLCCAFLRERILAKEPLSISLLQEVHRVLTEGTYDGRRYIECGERPGEFRKQDYGKEKTGKSRAGSRPERIKGELADLLRELDEFGGRDPFRAGTYFHARFGYIQPFSEGNGLAGRSLLNYWLMVNDYPPIIIYGKEKTAYHSALQAYDVQDELMPLADFLERQTLKTWERPMALAQQSNVEKQK